MCFSSSIYSLSRTGMGSLYLCIWKIIVSYRSKTLAFLGGRRNRELPEGKTFPIIFFFHYFWKSSFFYCVFCCCPQWLLESIFAVCTNGFSGWPTMLGASSGSRLPQFAAVFSACVSTGTHVRGVGVRVLGALGNSPRTCRSWCLLTEKYRAEKAREVFFRNSKMQLVEARLVLPLLC